MQQVQPLGLGAWVCTPSGRWWGAAGRTQRGTGSLWGIPPRLLHPTCRSRPLQLDGWELREDAQGRLHLQ